MQLLLDVLTLAYLLLQALLGQPEDSGPLAPLLGDLATHYPMDDDARRLVLLTGRRYAHEFPSVVHTPYGEAAHNLVVCRYLVFDDVAELGEGGVILGYRPLVTLAVRILARKQAAVDEVFGQYSIKRVQIPFALRLEETPYQSQIFFRRHSTPLPGSPIDVLFRHYRRPVQHVTTVDGRQPLRFVLFGDSTGRLHPNPTKVCSRSSCMLLFP